MSSFSTTVLLSILSVTAFIGCTKALQIPNIGIELPGFGGPGGFGVPLTGLGVGLKPTKVNLFKNPSSPLEFLG